MARFVTGITALGLHDRFDLDLTFTPGVNVLFGRNGAGKTTLLHLLANVLNSDYERFVFLAFRKISVTLDDGTSIAITQRSSDDDGRIIFVHSPHHDAIQLDQRAVIARDRSRAERFQESVHESQDEFEGPPPVLPVAYFPAFRTMIEAWSSVSSENWPRMQSFQPALPFADYLGRTRRSRQGPPISPTHFARELFGHFVPFVTFPSPLEIEDRIADEVRQAQLRVATTDRELLSEAFLNIFSALSSHTATVGDSPERLLQEIRLLSEQLQKTDPLSDLPHQSDIYAQLRQRVRAFQPAEKTSEITEILRVYQTLLTHRLTVQAQAFVNIKRYLAAVNRFLEGKQLALRTQLRPNRTILCTQFGDGRYEPLRILSSGERQLVTLIYAASHMSEQSVLLIDEPELSLHIDWQRELLKSMSEQVEGLQIIACTHSPMIGADYENAVREVILRQAADSSDQST